MNKGKAKAKRGPVAVCGACEKRGHETKNCPILEAVERETAARDAYWESRRAAESARVVGA